LFSPRLKPRRGRRVSTEKTAVANSFCRVLFREELFELPSMSYENINDVE
jgi:hypothetical protein